MVSQTTHKTLAPCKLIYGDPLIGLVGLRNMARAANNGGYASLMKQRRFGTKRHFTHALGWI
jgi:hypothetical protein